MAKAINKKSIEGLALSGAMDSFEGVSRAMFFVPESGDGTTLTDRMIKYGNQMNNGTDTSQASLFGGEDEIEIYEPQLPKVEPWNSLEQLAREKEVVGFFLGHPLDPYKLEIEHLCKANCAQLKAGLEPFKNKEVNIAKIYMVLKPELLKPATSSEKLSLKITMGLLNIMLFGKDFVEYQKFMVPQLFIFVKARVQERYNQPRSLELKVQKIELLDDVKQKAFSNLKVKIDLNKLTDELISNLEALFRQFEGKMQSEFYVEDPTENISVKLHSKGYKVAINSDLIFELDRIGDVSCELN